jgi:SAM-dependent methyltransferase
MEIINKAHSEFVHSRRVRQLCKHLSALIAPDSSVLDVGCGDGLLAHTVSQTRPDITVRGVDVLLREKTYFPVDKFDGENLPYAANSFDVVMFVDVLHHTENPYILLREAVRVARKSIVLKDHTQNGLFAHSTLRFMDYVGNKKYGVNLPYNYWTQAQWNEAIKELKLTKEIWEKDLALYPLPADLIFGRSLHFVAKLAI